MSKQRNHRRQPPALNEPTEESVEQGQDDGYDALLQEKMALHETLGRTIQERETLRAQTIEQGEALRAAAEYISQLEAAAMLTTQNMPGGEIITPTATEIEQYTGVSAPQPTPATQVCHNGDLGPCVRDVVHVRDQRPESVISVTYDTGKAYEIVFKHGRAKVPVTIADYIHRENPGDCMRTV